MAEDFKSIPVPPPIQAEVRILVEKLQEHAGDDFGFANDDIELLAPPQGKNFDVATSLVTVALLVPSTLLTSVSKAWLEKYVTPVIMERLHPPSEQFKQWLRHVFKVK
jgi:hypothetical protein